MVHSHWHIPESAVILDICAAKRRIAIDGQLEMKRDELGAAELQSRGRSLGRISWTRELDMRRSEAPERSDSACWYIISSIAM